MLWRILFLLCEHFQVKTNYVWFQFRDIIFFFSISYVHTVNKTLLNCNTEPFDYAPKSCFLFLCTIVYPVLNSVELIARFFVVVAFGDHMDAGMVWEIGVGVARRKDWRIRRRKAEQSRRSELLRQNRA